MFPTMIPEPFASVLAAYAGCFQARSYPTFQWLVLGWVQCLGRRTLTAVLRARYGEEEPPLRPAL